MYSVKVKTASSRPASYAAVAAGAAVGAAASAAASPSASLPATPSRATAGAPGSAAGEDQLDHVGFSAGNPRVEHMVGRVHLYRHLPPPPPVPPPAAGDAKQKQRVQPPSSLSSEIEPAASGDLHPAAAAAGGAPADLPADRTERLCILALPADMGFSELCTFMGAYFQHVREIRLVRREGRSSVCLVLLRFDSQQSADDYYRDFNGKAFCLLEPELLCRLVYVKDVEYQAAATSGSSGGGGSPAAAAAAAGAATAAAAAAAAGQAGVGSGVGNGFRAPPGTTELPTCPVCLERLDAHISGIVTTVCNHRFHNECLRQWGDTSCPVCRYCQHSNVTTSHCTVCNTSADLWICLICGHVGCGRYRGSHAADHWQSSEHGYALELETQCQLLPTTPAMPHLTPRGAHPAFLPAAACPAWLCQLCNPALRCRPAPPAPTLSCPFLALQRVWDYVNDSYVHRLIQSKTDGKLVEVPSPAQHNQPGCSGRPASRGPTATSECGSEQCYMDPEMEEAMVLSKLDALATEYNHLLVTQLESQRQYFEGQLVRQRAEVEQEVEAAGEAAAEARSGAAAAQAAAAESERRRRAAESKLADSSGRLAKAEEERQFLRQLNDTLLANQKEYQVRLKAAEEKLHQTAAEKDAAIRELNEQVRDLMVFLEARQTIQAAGGGDLEGGTVLPMPEQQQQQGHGGAGGGSSRRGKKR